MNARDASYAPAWEGYQSVASFDRTDFFRVPTTYTSGELVISHMIPEGHSACQYSYFAPYSYERHLDLIARCSASPLVQSYSLGQTLDKREIDCLEITDRSVAGDKKHALWIIARQHPGESMAEWLTEGLLERLLDPADPVASNLLKTAVIFVVPNVCPDGAIRGHLRTNAAGANLNREWAEPTLDRAPEVYWILQKMKETGVDFLLDVHGDEELPANFIAGLDGIPSFDGKYFFCRVGLCLFSGQMQYMIGRCMRDCIKPYRYIDLNFHSAQFTQSFADRLRGLQEMFTESLMRLSPDFQNKIGYGTDAPGRANLKLCSKAIGERFNTLSLTFEMPFKDAACNPEPIKGWSPERAKVLGKAIVGTLFEINPHLRARG